MRKNEHIQQRELIKWVALHTHDTRMNKTEALYAGLLDLRIHAGEVRQWEFEKVKLRLADNTFYTPDFWIIMSDGTMEMHEVKGFWRDDARVKVKVAAELYPQFRFIAVCRKKGGWEYEQFAPHK